MTITAWWTRHGPLALSALVAEIAIVASASAVLLHTARSHLPILTGGYTVWDGSLHPPAVAAWIASAGSEPTFYTCALSGIGLLAGGGFAHWLMVRGARGQGFTQACGTTAWPWVVSAALLGVVLSNLLWGWTVATTHAWQPLFVPFVSASPTIVLMYGPSLRTVLTGAGLGALTTTPLALLGTNYLCRWLDLPAVVGVTGGMAIGALIAFGICRVLPWLPQPVHLRQQEPPKSAPRQVGHSIGWSMRRILADFTEAQFFGSEWASLGLIAGAVMAYLLNPRLPAYGSGLLPNILTGQVLTAAIAVTLWHRQWSTRPFFPTFVPIVSVVPAAILTYGGTVASIIAGAVLGAVISPPLAAAISHRLPNDFHPFIGNVASMALSSALIVPALGLLPGFSA
ncbi:hypothetical protein [Nocardia sp. CDC160]|uniref:hypothetical protein n=1 Tax=Nocardia sp. CDC160 TaxID=3112166 RepID=UPI002DB64505|nr:hypothetical protein [Nocardia sp. CDC160]MEC3919219.1 hypothetical protein [Nocardia sp. CDC160]